MHVPGMELRIEYVKPDSLRPAGYNPRTISAEALKRLARLLDEHGFVDPVIARKEDRLIIAGHQRIRANAMRQRPDERVPVVFLNALSDARAKAMNVALNNPSAQGQFIMPALAELLSGLADDPIDLPELTGFAEDHIEELVANLDAAAGEEGGIDLPECFQVVVECDGEDQQRELYQRMTGEGFRCRLLVM